MSVSSTKRARQQQILREAEGYLELLTVFEDQWPLGRRQREPLARRALELLGRVGRRHPEQARVQFLRGHALRIMERYDEAVEPLEVAAELMPDQISIWLMLGWCYKRCGRLDLAIRALEKASRVDPSEAIVFYNLACYWSLAGHARKAIPLLAKAFHMDPNYREMVSDEPDFDPLRDHPDFRALVTVTV